MFKGRHKRNRFFQRVVRGPGGRVLRRITYEMKSGARVYVAHDTAGIRKTGDFAGFTTGLLSFDPFDLKGDALRVAALRSGE